MTTKRKRNEVQLCYNFFFFGLKHLCAYECDLVMAILFKEVGYIKTIDLVVNHSLSGMYLSVQFSFMVLSLFVSSKTWSCA
jgi:hypothetical protein